MRARTTILIALLILLCAGVVWFAQWDVLEATVADTVSPSAVSAERDATGQVATEAFSDEPRAATTRRIEALVVRADGGAPVPGAHLLWAERNSLARKLRNQTGGAAMLELIEDGAQSARADAQGRAWLPVPDAPLTIVARSGDAIGGAAWWPGDDRQVTIAVSDSVDIIVQTVGADGQPRPGVPVLIKHQGGRLRATTTSPSALARFPGVSLLGHAGRRDWSPEAFVDFDFPVRQKCACRVDLVAPPREPVVLRLPPTGSVLVRLENPDGTPYRGRAAVDLRERTGSLASARSAADPPSRVYASGVAVRAGPTRLFPLVGVGSTLDARVYPPAPLRPARTFAPGPSGPGEQAIITVRMGAAWPVVTGRALDTDGTVAARRKFEWSLQRRRGRFRSSGATHTISTDSQGRFRLVLSDISATSSEFKLELVTGGESIHPDFTRKLGDVLPDQTELGDVTLPFPRPLFGGVVVAADGRPVPGAKIRVETQKPDPSGRNSDFWRIRLLFSTTSDAAGRFTVKGVASELSYRIRVSTPGLAVLGPLPVVVGDHSLRLELASACSLAGWLRLRPGVRFTGRVVPVIAFTHAGSEGQDANQAAGGFVTHDGRFRLDGLRPGVGTLAIGHLKVENVSLEAGKVNRDPRLQGLDVSDVWRMITIAVVDQSGAVVEDASVTRWFERSGTTSRLDRDGRWRTLADEKPLDLTIRAPGRSPRRLRAVNSDQTVVLRPAARVALALTGVEPLQPPWILEVSLVPRSKDVGRSRDLTQRLDARGQVIMNTVAPGSYSVRYRLMRRRPPRLSRSKVFDSDQVVTVGDDPTLQHLDLTPEPARLAEARRILGG